MTSFFKSLSYETGIINVYQPVINYQPVFQGKCVVHKLLLILLLHHLKWHEKGYEQHMHGKEAKNYDGLQEKDLS